MNTTYHKIASLFLSPEQYSAIKDTVLDSDSLYTLLVEQYECLLYLDWTGESNDNELYEFIKAHLAQQGESIEIDTNSIYEAMCQEFDKGNLKRGDAIPYLINVYKQYLPQDYVIIVVDTQSDYYLLGITTRTIVTELSSLDTDFGTIREFNNDNENEVLYIMTCQCRMDNIWQPPKGEPAPTEGECDSCGTRLFDNEGKPYFTIIREQV